MNNKKGFTFLEVLIVAVVISILALAAIPKYMKMIERTKAKEAVSVLNLVVLAQRDYKLENDVYLDAENITQINSGFGLHIQNNDNWDFDVLTGVGCCVQGPCGPPYSYTVNAHRKGSGPYSDCIYSITVNSCTNTTLPPPETSGNCP